MVNYFINLGPKLLGPKLLQEDLLGNKNSIGGGSYFFRWALNWFKIGGNLIALSLRQPGDLENSPQTVPLGGQYLLARLLQTLAGRSLIGARCRPLGLQSEHKTGHLLVWSDSRTINLPSSIFEHILIKTLTTKFCISVGGDPKTMFPSSRA